MIDVTYMNHMGGDITVVNAARVSFGKRSGYENGELSEKDRKLIHYLARYKHTSPFGHCFASFHVHAPIFVARQLVKHKFLRWNEISRRYVDEDPKYYVPDVWRGRSADKKQGSEGEVSVAISNIHYHNENTQGLYRQLIDEGVAPEQARMVLPQSVMTEWYWSGSLDAFADMCNLRLKDDTQYETGLVAEQIDQHMLELFPIAWEALVYEDADE